jgi:hypothetical protein
VAKATLNIGAYFVRLKPHAPSERKPHAPSKDEERGFSGLMYGLKPVPFTVEEIISMRSLKKARG